MRAVVYDRYGPPEVLRVEDVPQPVPQADELLIRIRATTVNRLDVHTREANRSSGRVVMALSRLVSGVRRPRQRILGSELAGEVEAVGSAVHEFKPGDRVFGMTGLRFGAHAEYTCAKESSRIARMPSNATFEEAAAVCDGGMNALSCLRRVTLQRGKSVLVYGASGSIGTAGVQLARHFGADVTAVCTTKNFDLMRSLGAVDVIDYTKEDFTRNGKTYDVIFDAVGKHSFKRCKDSLKPGGYYLATDGFRNLLLTPWTALFGEKKVIFTIPPQYPMQDLLLLRQLIEAREYRPVIDRCYPLEDMVEAARYVETEQKTGNVVITI
jgi:NADPH:quinone reductase-like Zn-dependent oxidoreductase